MKQKILRWSKNKNSDFLTYHWSKTFAIENRKASFTLTTSPNKSFWCEKYMAKTSDWVPPTEWVQLTEPLTDDQTREWGNKDEQKQNLM